MSFFVAVYDIIFFNMYLKRLEILGFKSFAKKGNLEFNSPISAIVGPNGSGKSNVAESIRFVLGEQSMKSLRGKRGEDLIWNGSGNTPRSNHASVTIIFDNTKKEFDIDYDEVAIKREVYRDGVNQYFINNSQVRLKDIFELLAKVHIGATGHHIISQGEADRVLNANIKERRTMVEDALGLKIYKWKIEESDKKLLKTDENMKQVHSLRREIAPHIKFLKKQVDKIEKVKEMRNELHLLYADYLNREDEYIKYEKERIEKEKKIPKEELRSIDIKLTKARELLSENDSVDPKKDQLIDIEKQIEEIRNKKDELSRKIGRIEGMIEFENRRAQKTNIVNSKVEFVSYGAVREFTDNLKKYLADTDGKSPDVVNNILREVREMLSKFIVKISGKSVQEEGNVNKDELEELVEEKDNINKRLSEVIKEEQNLDNNYKKLKSEIESDKDSSRETERAMFEMMSTRSELLSKLNIILNSEEKLEREERLFKEEIKEGMALIGRGITEYQNVSVSKEEVINEDRELQDDRRKKIEKIKIKLEVEGIGGVQEIIKEYKETVERDEFLEKELEDLDKSRESLRQLINDLTEKLDNDFKIGIQKINSQFQEFFSLMFGGGNASLKVVSQKSRKRKDTNVVAGNEEDLIDNVIEEEREEGIDINVSLPRKKIKGLQMLSGGERALTSIALIFAVSQVNPPPFLVLDETDAALDEANSRKYGDIIEALSKHSQLIVITHNRETMARANILYGVTMGADAASKLLSVRFDEATTYAK